MTSRIVCKVKMQGQHGTCLATYSSRSWSSCLARSRTWSTSTCSTSDPVWFSPWTPAVTTADRISRQTLPEGSWVTLIMYEWRNNYACSSSSLRSSQSQPQSLPRFQPQFQPQPPSWPQFKVKWQRGFPGCVAVRHTEKGQQQLSHAHLPHQKVVTTPNRFQ